MKRCPTAIRKKGLSRTTLTRSPAAASAFVVCSCGAARHMARGHPHQLAFGQALNSEESNAVNALVPPRGLLFCVSRIVCLRGCVAWLVPTMATRLSAFGSRTAHSPNRAREVHAALCSSVSTEVCRDCHAGAKISAHSYPLAYRVPHGPALRQVSGVDSPSSARVIAWSSSTHI